MPFSSIKSGTYIRLVGLILAVTCVALIASSSASATPANKAALEKYFGRFLPAKLDSCTTCHLPKKFTSTPSSLAEFPHNSFGRRLAIAADELRRAGKRTDIPTRMRLIASEDKDGDGIDNLSELLLGHAPGDAADRPTAVELKRLPALKAAFAQFLAQYRWQPFEPVQRPTLPHLAVSVSPLPVSGRGRGLGSVTLPVSGRGRGLGHPNPIDLFLTEQRNLHGLTPRPPAPKDILLRRVYLDLIGLSPTPEEITEFETDNRPDAYERVVDRLLASPRYGERWGRHWMDVWRYSDWPGWADGNQIRDSKPFIWRWRDWIVESLNADKGYDQMVREMLAADELAPENTDALRATGYLVRNYKLLSREQWMDDLLNHIGRAFLGITLGCAKCHNHMYDPITQADYYRVRAVFEPHNVRTDRIPGQPDTTKDGLVHAFDADLKTPTYLFIRGDERNPDKSSIIAPGVPESLGGALSIKPIELPHTVSFPDRRDFVVAETIAAGEQEITKAKQALDTALPATDSPSKSILEKRMAVAKANQAALLAVLDVEKLEDAGDKSSDTWQRAAEKTHYNQIVASLAAADLNIVTAQQVLEKARAAQTPGKPDPKTDAAVAAAQTALTKANKDYKEAQIPFVGGSSMKYTPRATLSYPTESTGRRSAFARWLTDNQNPLAARVAVNQIWMRHFGTGIVPSVDDFGRNGRPPSNPRLLDWLAAELIAQHWRMKPIHRLIVTSTAYRMASTSDTKDAWIDLDDVFLWRMPSQRMAAELVRDNILYVSGSLDETMGGPEVDHTLGLTSRRRSIYLRTAAEKQVEFLQIFDGPSVTECYARKPSVMPQQALALANSELAIGQARLLADVLTKQAGNDDLKFVQAAFLRTLARRPTSAELKLCAEFVKPTNRSGTITASAPPPGDQTKLSDQDRKRMNLILVLFNHNDFVTIR